MHNDDDTTAASDIKGAKVTIGLGHVHVDPADLPAIVQAIGQVMARFSEGLDPYRARTDSDDRLYFLDLTVKAKVA